MGGRTGNTRAVPASAAVVLLHAVFFMLCDPGRWCTTATALKTTVLNKKKNRLHSRSAGDWRVNDDVDLRNEYRCVGINYT